MTWPVPVILSHQCWQRRYRGDPGIIGQTITLNNLARPVVGVLPATFSFPRPETEIWMLFVPPERTANFARRLDYRAVARLRPGVSAAAAATELERILPSIEGVYADATAERLAEVQLKPMVVPLKEEMIADVRTFLLLLLGGTTFLLLVAYANTATLSLLRAEYRHREMAVRIALGARPADLMVCRQFAFPPYPDCPIPMSFYPVVNISLMWFGAPLAAYICRRNVLIGLSSWGLIMANGFVHSAGGIAGVYNTGLVTAAFLFIPLSLWVIYACAIRGPYSGKVVGAAIAAGAVTHDRQQPLRANRNRRLRRACHGAWRSPRPARVSALGTHLLAEEPGDIAA